MINRIRYFVSVFVVLTHLLCARHACGQVLPFTNYNTVNGLIHNRIHILHQDGKGYIWMGTDMGIDRYDGRAFKHFPCPGNPYQAARLSCQNNDSVVFGLGFFGMAVCYGDSVRFTKLNPGNGQELTGVSPIPDGSYTISYAHSLFLVRGDNLKSVPLSDSITGKGSFTDHFRDRRSNIWLMTANGLVVFPAGNILHPVDIPFFKHKYINIVRQDGNGDIYIACNYGVYRYKEIYGIAELGKEPELILPHTAEVTSFAFDKFDNVWMGTTFKGLLRYNKTDKAVDYLGVENGLVSQNIWDVFCDRENNIWAAAENGLAKLTTQSYFSFDFRNSEYQSVKGACIWNDSTLIFSNLMYAYRYTKNSVTKIDGYKNTPGLIQDLFMRTPDNKLLVNITVPHDSGNFA